MRPDAAGKQRDLRAAGPECLAILFNASCAIRYRAIFTSSELRNFLRLPGLSALWPGRLQIRRAGAANHLIQRRPEPPGAVRRAAFAFRPGTAGELTDFFELLQAFVFIALPQTRQYLCNQTGGKKRLTDRVMQVSGKSDTFFLGRFFLSAAAPRTLPSFSAGCCQYRYIKLLSDYLPRQISVYMSR